ncbi:MAG: BatA domain-containing protein [Bacteroidia bacterium]
MTFLYPSFLYALGLMVIPIIIHLFNFRKFKRQEFTQVKFLEKASKVKKRFKQIRDVIIMLLRMLAIGCLVLAFAHPIPKEVNENSQKQSIVSIYLDNSFSMALQSENGELLAEGKKKVEEIADAFGENSLFQLITNNISERSRGFIEKELFLQSLEKVDLEPFVLTEEEINQLQQSELLSNNGNRVQVVISDFQKQNFELTSQLDSTITRYWVKIDAEKESNISVDTAWFEQALFVKDQNAQLIVQVTNHSENKLESRSIVVKINGTQRAIQTFDLLPNETKELELFYLISNEGWNKVEVEIEDYPIEFDNTIYTSYFVKPSTKVLSLYTKKANPFVRKVYSNDFNFQFEQIELKSLGAGSLDIYDLIIIEDLNDLPSGNLEQIISFINNGGNVAIFPSAKAEITDVQLAYKRFGINLSEASQERISINNLELNHPFFSDIFEDVPKNIEYPKVFKHFKSNLKTRTNAQGLISLSNGNKFLYLAEIGKGRAFIATSALDVEHNNLVKNGIFVPLLYKMASYRGQQSSSTYFIDSKPTEVNISGASNSAVMGLSKNGIELIPNQVYRNAVLTIFEDEIQESGFYDVKEMNKNDSVLYVVGFNYNRRESNMSFWDKEEIMERAEEYEVRFIEKASLNISSIFKDLNDKNRLWRYFLIAAFCFLLFEIIAIKLPFK